MKNFLLKLIKFKCILIFFLILQSCFGGNNEIDLLEIDRFDQLQILRDGTKIDTTYMDSCAIILDTIITKEN
tara:strand:- start:3579 stop:3794 length:216 start_codon:yes stop_codon:yes gene_type:complete